MNRRGILIAAALGVLRPYALAESSALSDREDVAAFIAEMAEQHGFSAAEVAATLDDAKILGKVLDLMAPPGDSRRKKTYWSEYRSRHLTPRNVVAGIKFFREHEKALQDAELKYGVQSEIIAGIIGIETRYGSYLGDFRILDALVTLAFEHPTRAGFFRGELEELLLLSRADSRALEFKGSFAGASGIPQFLPSSLRRWGVDFDGDGVVDLYTPVDAIGSVANFLKEHGWERGREVSFPAEVSETPSALEGSGVLPSLSLSQLEEAGVEVDFAAAPPHDGPYALVTLENLYDTEYRVGTMNYYVLTRYNRSSKYAMAVLDLSREISRRR